MTKEEIVASMKKTWTEQLQKKDKDLTESILDGYVTWVQGLVKQVTEQQAVAAQQSQQVPQQPQQQAPNLQGGAA